MAKSLRNSALGHAVVASRSGVLDASPVRDDTSAGRSAQPPSERLIGASGDGDQTGFAPRLPLRDDERATRLGLNVVDTLRACDLSPADHAIPEF